MICKQDVDNQLERNILYPIMIYCIHIIIGYLCRVVEEVSTVEEVLVGYFGRQMV